MGTCEEFVLQVKLGTTQSGGAEISTEVYASQLGLRPGDEFEILLSADEQPGNWFALDPDATFVHVRDYYFDWQPREAGDVRDRAPRHARAPGRDADRRESCADAR